MGLTKIGQVWEITSLTHPRSGDKFIIISLPIVTEPYVPGTNIEDHTWIEFRYGDGLRGAGSVGWVRHECTIRADSDYPTR